MDHSDPFQKLKSVRMETETLSLEACTGTILCYLPRQTMEPGRLRVSGADRRGTGLGCGRIGPLFQSDLGQSLYSHNVDSGN